MCATSSSAYNPAMTTSPSRDPIDRLKEAVVTPMAVRAALSLDVFTPLAGGPMTAEELARALGVRPRRLGMLLGQLVVAAFLERHGDRFANSAMAAHYLVKGGAAYVGALDQNWARLWTAQMQTDQSIRTDQPQAKIDFEGMSTAELSGFLKGLHPQAMAAGRGLAANPAFAKAERVVDIAGGSGGVAIALCQAHPHLSVTVIDLPAVVPIGRDMVAEAGLTGRITVKTADILAGPLTGDFDIATARAFFQVLSAADCATAARNIAAAIPSGGEIFVIGFVMDDDGLSPERCVAQNLQWLNVFDDGQAYSESQYRGWLSDAGFTAISRRPEAQGRSLITARKA